MYKSEEINSQNNFQKLSASVWNSLGNIYSDLNNSDSSLVCYKKSIGLYKMFRDTSDFSIVLMNIGTTYFDKAQHDSALYYLDEALKYSRKMDEWEKELKGKILVRLAKTHSKLNHQQKSKEYMANAISFKDSIFTKLVLSEVYENISELLTYNQDHENALVYYKRYKELQDTLFTQEKSQQIQELETRYQSRQQKMENEYQKLKIKNQENEIRKQLIQKTSIMGGFILLLIISVIIYRSNRIKNKSNALLKKQKEQIEIMSEKIHKTDQMKISFFTNISHELRTPLSVIHGLADEIYLEKKERNIKIIRQNTVKLTALVNQMLDLRKLDDDEMTVNIVHGDIGSFISRVIVMLESLAIQKGITIEYRHDREKINGYFDPDKLETIEPKEIAVSPLDKAFLERAVVIIEQNISNTEFSPGEFVDKLGMSRSFVYKKLKSLTGQSASRFIESIRLRTAIRLLKENNKNISEVAYEVGFSDPTYFCRQFKKTFKKTPKEYIKK